MPELALELRHAETGEVVPIRELSTEEAMPILETGEIVAAELVPWGSNHTFAVALQMPDGAQYPAIYKPIAGERPLHDFPFGTLHKRERAAWLLSETLGWGIVPPTVIRDGPYGEGSLQAFVPTQPGKEGDEEYWGEETIEIERIVLFDHLANNADRKVTHCLVSESGKAFGIDHGLCFHAVPKLRIALWQFEGGPIRPELHEELNDLVSHAVGLTDELRHLLSTDEVAAFLDRLQTLATSGWYPTLDPRFNIPYGWW